MIKYQRISCFTELVREYKKINKLNVDVFCRIPTDYSFFIT